MQEESIEHPKGSGITIREVANFTTVNGERKGFGSSWLATIPAKRTNGRGRVRKQHDSLADAKEWAERENAALKQAGSDYLELASDERIQAASAFKLAREAKLCLTTLVTNAIAAVKLLGTPEKLPEAARFFQERKGKVKPVPVLDAIAELLAEKAQDGASFVHAKDLRLRLDRFAETFGLTNVADLDAPQIDTWLRGLDVGKRSRINYRRVVLTFLRFCERRGWLARGAIEGASISSPKVKANGAIEIFTPEELRLLLEQSSDKMRPYFVLGGLCGLRTAESLRLEWDEIDFKRNTITIEAAKAKTASRRIVPLCPAARAWLLPLRQDSGRVLPYYHVAKEVDRFLIQLNKTRADDNQFEWRANALRHTYVSARMAILKDAAKVATECGNSPAMIFSNYRELVHDDVAEAWFAVSPAPAVMPAPAENVVELEKAS